MNLARPRCVTRVSDASSGSDALAGLDREVVRLALANLVPDLVALVRRVPRLDAGDDRFAAHPIGLGAGGRASRRPIDEGVGAELFYQVDDDGDAALVAFRGRFQR